MLMAATVSCHRTSEAEARLIAIDSLIPEAPDSALTLLEAFDTASLRGEMRAYHALLTAQALYKAYIPATSDSLINRAWDYYKDHGSYDRRIRAMLYKGTTAEELGHPEEAMRWYKRTELESRPDDHYHRGYALMSMGQLYRNQYIAKKESIKKYKQALSDFHKGNYYDLELYCMTEIGSNYLTVNNDSALAFINKALMIAIDNNDSMIIHQNLESLLNYYFISNDWKAVKETSSKLITIDTAQTNHSSLLYSTMAFINLGMLDSAIYMIEKSNMSYFNSKDSIIYFKARSLIEKELGNHSNYELFSEKANDIADNKIIFNKKSELIRIEEESLNISVKSKNQLLQKSIFKLMALILVAVVCLLSFIFFFRKRIKLMQVQLEHEQNELKNARIQLKTIKDRSAIDNKSSKSQTINQLQNKCINLIFQNTVYSGIRGTSIFKYIFDIEHAERRPIVSIDIPKSFWKDLRRYIDLVYPEAFDNILSSGIKLNKKECELIMLDCINIPNAVVSIILGYSDRSTASIRYRIITKLNCQGLTFDEYLRNHSIKECNISC